MSRKLKAIFSVDGYPGMHHHHQPKYSLANTVSSATAASQSGRSPAGSRRVRKQQLWSLSPAAFHQSFDDRLRSCEDSALSNSCKFLDVLLIFNLLPFRWKH